MSRKPIAVIVVHGVADQQPRDSARQIAALLSDCTDAYPSGFLVHDIRVPLTPVLDATHRTEEKNAFAEAFRIEERSGTTTSAGREIEHAFMYEQLRDYEPGAERVFETVRLEGERKDGTRVHVYEAYWADVSRVGTGIAAFFGELYQLVLHLPSLGRIVVSAECALRDDPPVWRLFAFFQRWLVRWLTLLIAPINLTIATLILPLIATRLQPQSRLTVIIAAVLAAVGGTAVAGLVLRRFRLPWVIWAIAPFVAAVIAMGLVSFAITHSTATHVVLFELWLLSALLIGAVFVSYNQRRPGALGVGAVLLAISGGLLAYRLAVPSAWDRLPAAVVRVIEIANITLQLAWRLHIFWLYATIIVAVICIAATRDDRARAVRASWMGIITVCLATTVFAALTPAFWAAILRGITAFLPLDAAYERLDLWPELHIRAVPQKVDTIEEWVRFVVIERASGVFVVQVIVLLAFVFALVWSIFPSVLVEARPPRSSKPGRAIALGTWLSHGLRAIPWAALIVPAGGVSLSVLFALRREQLSASAVAWAGAAVLALIAARFWLPGASSALDVALDVDNYLREHPRRSTPRARIAERFTSLLAFVRRAAPYDATIVIAHSQGSVITADLLRFLKKIRHPVFVELTEKRLALFTMGSPLRQLYARAFSPLYLWMNPDAQTTDKPDPEELGVSVWMNAYRSGDYVGRNLWCHRKEPDLWTEYFVEDPSRTRVEMCLGEGAHTHYWDSMGADIARELDRLIRPADPDPPSPPS